MNQFLLSSIIVGMVFLCASLAPIRAILRELSAGSLRNQWRALNAIVIGFVIGYAVFALMMLRKDAGSADLVVGTILSAGGAFVLIVTSLFRRTVADLTRIADLERDILLDPLTNVFNRRYLKAQLDQDIDRSFKHHEPLSTLLIDIDYFKRVNDTYGHQVGDGVLRHFSALLENLSRSMDTVARYGGEEFVIIVPGYTEAVATEFGERLRSTIESSLIPLGEGGSISVTASIGVSTLKSNDGASDLLRRADKALYAAKRGGRNQVFAFRPELIVNTA